MTKSVSPEAVAEFIQMDFQLSGHKATIGLVLENSDIYLVSEMRSDFVEHIFLNLYSTVQSAPDASFEKLGKEAAVLVMPYVGSNLPTIDSTLN